MKEKVTINGSFEMAPIKLSVITWMPEGRPAKILHILHGMAEYAERYHDFAEFLNAQGIGVVAHDHRQHGESLREASDVGIFDTEDTWNRVVEDVEIVQKYIREQYKVPMCLLGHSMGSVIARNYLQKTKLPFDSAVFSGVPDMATGLWRLGVFIANILGLFNKNKPSPFLNNLSVGAYNKSFQPSKTNNDWLSKDEKICISYEKDPLCGYAYNPRFYAELSKGFINAYKASNIKKMPKIHMLFVTGADDPVGVSKEHMVKVFDHYKNNGLGNQAKQFIFGGMRHEILNEVEKEKVYQLVYSFITE